MAVPHSHLGLAGVRLQASANPSHKVILKQNTNPFFLPRCSCKHFVLPLEVTGLREAEFYRQVLYRLVLFSSFQSLGRVEASSASFQYVGVEGK